MDNPPRSTHPMVIVAATSVTLASLVAMAWFAGFLPNKQEQPQATQATVAHAATPTTQAPPQVAVEKAAAPTAPKAAAKQVHDVPIPPARRVERQAPSRDPSDTQYNYSASAPMNDVQSPYPQKASNNQYVNTCRDCGVVESVREIKQEGEGSGLGAIGGGVVGGLLGNQIGGGRGKTVGAVVGAVGGAYAGNEVEKNVRSTKRYDITIRLDDGNTRVFSEQQPPAFQRGDRIRIANGQLVRM